MRPRFDRYEEPARYTARMVLFWIFYNDLNRFWEYVAKEAGWTCLLYIKGRHNVALADSIAYTPSRLSQTEKRALTNLSEALWRDFGHILEDIGLRRRWGKHGSYCYRIEERWRWAQRDAAYREQWKRRRGQPDPPPRPQPPLTAQWEMSRTDGYEQTRSAT